MWRFGIMSTERAVSRISHFTTVLAQRPALLLRYCSSTSGNKVVTIGGASISIKEPKSPEYVPIKYLEDDPSQSLLKHLRWIIQKDVLGQDIFLIGPPGPLRRSLSMMYAELTQKEIEYISLSRDTTESDLKQRREIQSGTAFHVDQCAVRAAVEGRILILEGIEKAERNVLPVLNNLLENREMQLDDGRFLMSAKRYDQLLKDHSKEELDGWKLVRVSEDFRVIALGLPVPRYQGNPLDPPLRSRFQARDINPLPFNEQLEFLKAVGGSGVSGDTVGAMLSFASTLKSTEAIETLGLPDFPIDHLDHLVKILSVAPSVPTERVLSMAYPYNAMLSKEGITAVTDALKKFNLQNQGIVTTSITEIRRKEKEATVLIKSPTTSHGFQVKSGAVQEQIPSNEKFIHTELHDQLLAEMAMSHMCSDFCVIGSRGCGKSLLVKQFAEMFGYETETIMLYQDMTWRDLVQQRMTMPNGDTAWRPSPLIMAAQSGNLAVLDGVHRINPGTFAVLHRLIHDREIALFDGTRLVGRERYDEIKKQQGLSDEQMREKGVLCIHPAFRMVALGEPPVPGSPSQQWLNAEMLTMFLYHHMRELTQAEELFILKKLVPHLHDMKPIMELVERLRHAQDTNLRAVATSLSTRQLLRIARRFAQYPAEDMYGNVQKACLGRFLPRMARSALDEALEKQGIEKPAATVVQNMENALKCEVKDGVLRIGSTTVNIYQPDNLTKVPDVIFYDNPQHLHVMEDMLKDFLLGEHLLLIGNQGVGKNKIVDRFLHLLNRPREYIQLHRDTTVQTLTLQPTVQDGVIRYDDSPLVQAVKKGHILVVDEADKAPTNVTCILKTLVEAGEMHLSDGRRIVSANSSIPPSPNVIHCHPDFRMIVLANRPGFPFLGNDFFGAMGDIFSCHAVDNPSVEGEIGMLRQYGPTVPEEILRKLVNAFSELRDMADQGLITYPYSTREVVNMVKHLEMYPDEGLAQVVQNVFDFDSYNKELKETLVTTLHKHGIPVGANPRNIHLAKQFPLPPVRPLGSWSLIGPSGSATARMRTAPMSCPIEDRQIRVKGPVQVPVQRFQLDRTEARASMFTEQEAFWTIPLHETSAISTVAVTLGKNRLPDRIDPDVIHVATVNPVSVYSMVPNSTSVTCLDLYDLFPYSRNLSQRPRIHLAPLGFPLGNNLLLHEEVSNTLLDINWESGDVRRLELSSSFLGSAAESITKNFRQSQGVFRMCSDFSQDSDGMVLLYKQDGQAIDCVHMLDGRSYNISLPIKVTSINMLSRYDWLLTDSENTKYILRSTKKNPLNFTLQTVEEASLGEKLDSFQVASKSDLHDSLLSAAIGQNIKSPNRVFCNEENHAIFAVGLPELTKIDLHHIPREPATDDNKGYIKSLRFYGGSSGGEKSQPRDNKPVSFLPDSGQIVRIVPDSQVPKAVYPNGIRPKHLSGYMEVSDPVNKLLRYVPIPGVDSNNVYHQWSTGGSDVSVVLATMSHDGLVTVDAGGCVRLWETALMHLDNSLRKWQSLIGEEDRPMQITTEKELGKEPEGPKHGRIDPTNAPHVGGNQWAGGTGGRDTAGLGGVGGPYRLDAGHDVTQVSQADKDAVPEDVRRAAREMGQKAYKQRLREIEMSEFDGDLYEQYSKSVRGQVKALRVILESLQAKSKEREWLRHQTHGDLDEAKLIEGLTGEKAIYRRRGEKEPEMGTPQQKPKLIRILCDVSGSMYRFNGHDARMDRQLEAMLMVMESFESYQHKVKYEIRGHSGEGFNFKMMKEDSPPKNPKEKLNILKALHAHSQFCISGDHTVEATEHAIRTITEEEADEHFVIVLSDANFDRYGIRPRQFADVLTSNEDVNAFVIFIGTLGDQANRLIKQLPSGKAFLCMDTKNLPNILQQIFTSTMLK